MLGLRSLGRRHSVMDSVVVDLDGTLAYYNGWKGKEHIGDRIPKMLERVKEWIRNGQTVKIFTARVEDKSALPYIQNWLEKYRIGGLKVTNIKTPDMSTFYGDRAVEVIKKHWRNKRQQYECE